MKNFLYKKRKRKRKREEEGGRRRRTNITHRNIIQFNRNVIFMILRYSS